jgi:hypothetical protein
VRVFFTLLSTIGFDNETRLGAKEIDDVIADWMLAAEAESRELLAA